jgi:hypothetical protein
MEGAEARCDGGDPMDFSWTVDGERPCAGPSRDEEAAPAPAPAQPLSPQELAESMILVSGPRVVTSGLRQGDCRSGAVPIHASLVGLVPCASVDSNLGSYALWVGGLGACWRSGEGTLGTAPPHSPKSVPSPREFRSYT